MVDIPNQSRYNQYIDYIGIYVYYEGGIQWIRD